MVGSWKLLLMILGVDMVCGPLLTLVAANSNKPKSELLRDFIFIAIIQLSALSYGVYALFQSRPVMEVFDKDRFYVVSALQIDPEELKKAPIDMQQLPFVGLMKAGIRKAKTEQEFFYGIDLSLAGIPPAVRPGWWISEKEVESDIDKAKIPLSSLVKAKPEVKAILVQYINEKDIPNLFYIPFTSEKTAEWIVILDNKKQRLEYIPVDGFVNE